MKRFIWNQEDCYNDTLRSDCEIATGVEISPEVWSDIIYGGLENARRRLNQEVQGVIVCFAMMGFGHGEVPGSTVFGSTISSILHSSDNPCWFGEEGDIRGAVVRHDGMDRVLYRIAPDMDTAKKLSHAIAYEGLSEEEFKAKTTSLYPVVAKILGW